MKKLLAVLFAGLFAVAITAQAGSRETARIAQGKITKNEAQHLILKKFPGATISKCELKSADGHSFWAVVLMKAGSKESTRVQVDGRSGQITP